jgi:hypothetical protein
MKKQLFALCPDCGNARKAIEKICPFCGSEDLPPVSKKLAGIFTLNLEEKLPTVDQALEKFDSTLEELSLTAIRVVKVIHGYGSKGKGGSIKEAIHQELIYQKRSHIIDSYIAGEDLVPTKTSHQDFFKRHPTLKNMLTKDIFGNPGITLIILKR